ncbi:MAG: acyltransferase family protein [Prevotella sp.]|nr:acyltransferase family protein [Prevotella sp.]
MNRLECSTLRCIAIVSIMLHNFCHWLPGAAPENEFSFSLEQYYYFWNSLLGKDFIIQIFSFFGHLGVPVFVFLTGYGLAQKYDKMEQLEWKSFLYNHWRKLFIPLVVGTFVYLFVMYVIEGHLVCSVSRIIAQLTMFLNFISPMHLLPMPYWYLGMTMQLYIIYLLFVHRHPLTPLLLLTIASLVFMACFVGFPQVVVVSKFNCVGWLAPLCIGIAYSRYQAKVHVERGCWLMGLSCLSLILVLLCGFNYYAWLLTPLFVVILAVGIVKYIPVLLQQRMDYIGRNSLYFLIVHPITRELIMPIVPIIRGHIGMILYLFTTFFVVYVFLLVKNKFW